MLSKTKKRQMTFEMRIKATTWNKILLEILLSTTKCKKKMNGYSLAKRTKQNDTPNQTSY